MKKVIRLTENDLIRLVRRVINEETDLSSSVKKFELFIDSNLTKSIGTYLFKGSDSGMGRVGIVVTPTSNSKFPCLKEFSYSVDQSFMKRLGFGRIPLDSDSWGNKGCNVPKVLYTNDDGEDVLNFQMGN